MTLSFILWFSYILYQLTVVFFSWSHIFHTSVQNILITCSQIVKWQIPRTFHRYISTTEILPWQGLRIGHYIIEWSISRYRNTFHSPASKQPAKSEDRLLLIHRLKGTIYWKEPWYSVHLTYFWYFANPFSRPLLFRSLTFLYSYFVSVARNYCSTVYKRTWCRGSVKSWWPLIYIILLYIED